MIHHRHEQSFYHVSLIGLACCCNSYFCCWAHPCSRKAFEHISGSAAGHLQMLLALDKCTCRRPGPGPDEASHAVFEFELFEFQRSRSSNTPNQFSWQSGLSLRRVHKSKVKMLAIPLKGTSKVDLVGPMKQYLLSKYPKVRPNRIQQLARNARGFSEPA